jgi:hypothetical protein
VNVDACGHITKGRCVNGHCRVGLADREYQHIIPRPEAEIDIGCGVGDIQSLRVRVVGDDRQPAVSA